MAVTATVYGKVFIAAFNKEIDLDSDTIKAMICTSSYTPSQSHDYKDDITNEIVGTGYTAGGVTLTGVTNTYNTGTKVWKFDANDASWGPGATFTGRYIVYYDSTPGSDATRPLLSWVDFGSDVAISAGTLNDVLNALGIISLTVA